MVSEHELCSVSPTHQRKKSQADWSGHLTGQKSDHIPGCDVIRKQMIYSINLSLWLFAYLPRRVEIVCLHWPVETDVACVEKAWILWT